ncbi:hypothetical protein OF83DRAFT_3039 [Amylostereum chailletii]|nr:hypothetical protein OF83DRAFT_3039 [Amylostereum chailletii]
MSVNKYLYARLIVALSLEIARCALSRLLTILALACDATVLVPYYTKALLRRHEIVWILRPVSYTSEFELVCARIRSRSAVLHRAQTYHRKSIHPYPYT